MKIKTSKQIEEILLRAYNQRDDILFDSGLQALKQLDCKHNFVSGPKADGIVWIATCDKCGVDYSDSLQRIQEALGD